MERWLNKHRMRRIIKTDELVAEFHAQFPGKCGLCSYHRFGFREGFLDRMNPPDHACIEGCPDGCLPVDEGKRL
jgi:hypothetical protein